MQLYRYVAWNSANQKLNKENKVFAKVTYSSKLQRLASFAARNKHM